MTSFQVFRLQATVFFACSIITCARAPSDPGTVPVRCEVRSTVPVPFSQDASDEARAKFTPCARACDAWERFGCAENLRLPGGRSCLENCYEAARVSSFDPECVAKATSADGAAACKGSSCTPVR